MKLQAARTLLPHTGAVNRGDGSEPEVVVETVDAVVLA
jgi:hypothetical protein